MGKKSVGHLIRPVEVKERSFAVVLKEGRKKFRAFPEGFFFPLLMPFS